MKLEIVKNRVVATAETDAESLLLMRFSEKPTTLAEVAEKRTYTKRKGRKSIYRSKKAETCKAAQEFKDGPHYR